MPKDYKQHRLGRILRDNALTLQYCRDRPPYSSSLCVEENRARSAAESRPVDLNQERDLTPAYELPRASIRRHLHELTFDPAAIWQPHAHTIAVAGVRISGVGIGLQHGSV